MLEHLQKHWADKKYPRVCQECGSPFTSQRDYAKWCSFNCKHRVHEKRRYARNNEAQQRKKEYTKVYCRKWRLRKKQEGKCSRCGHDKVTENKVCSFCYESLKGGSW